MSCVIASRERARINLKVPRLIGLRRAGARCLLVIGYVAAIALGFWFFDRFGFMWTP